MEITSIFFSAVLVCAVVVVVSQVKSEFSFFIQLAAVVLILFSVFGNITQLFSQTKDLAVTADLNGSYIELMLKILLVALGGKVVCDICSDTGNRAVCTCVDIACKVSIMLLCLPMLSALLAICTELIEG